ncbi:hypothetical protein L1049_017894 [Liquidambar formosana]|uniref:Heme O synthase n=1 Tax=Liquidambar formosana TaxID=63359 RepID=A0AAP0R7J5_LIQFO
MWRNSASFSLKLLSSNPNPKPSLLHSLNGVIRPLSHGHIYSSIPSTPPSPDSLKLGFHKSDVIRSFATVTDPSSLASASLSKARDVVVAAQHYGRCYWELSKARLSMLVVATSGTGFVLGSGNAIDFAGLCWTCVGTMMVAASANSLNQVFEIKNDAKMKRTMHRPLPSGRLTIPHAVTWASSVGVAGTALLAMQAPMARLLQANMLAAGLAASNLVLYAFVYTPLKQIHPVNTWVGAVVGAIPPLLGWAAASGQVSLNGMILPAALYFWQIPHFMALAYLCRTDYATGGFRMFSLADASGVRTALVALRNCLYLIPLGFLAYDWGITSGWFCLESSLLAGAISATAFTFYLDRTTKNARRMFHASLLYLPVFMSGLLFHRLPDNQKCLAEDRSERIVKLPSSEILLQEVENVDSWKNVQHSAVGSQARPPVAFASVAPFPFLPAPSYAYP